LSAVFIQIYDDDDLKMSSQSPDKTSTNVQWQTPSTHLHWQHFSDRQRCFTDEKFQWHRK